jgi:hypothetical protein
MIFRSYPFWYVFTIHRHIPTLPYLVEHPRDAHLSVLEQFWDLPPLRDLWFVAIILAVRPAGSHRVVDLYRARPPVRR